MKKLICMCIFCLFFIYSNEEIISTKDIREYQKYLLIKEVKNVFKQFSPKTHISSQLLVESCLKSKIDIVFAISQGLLESNLGTKGKASRTNSIWNVGTCDDGSIKYRYATANHSIEPYLKLLKEKYLVNKTTDDLLIRFVSVDGYRYATCLTYEERLSSIKKKIENISNIDELQKVLNKNT
jgi:hypothetical protein